MSIGLKPKRWPSFALRLNVGMIVGLILFTANALENRNHTMFLEYRHEGDRIYQNYVNFLRKTLNYLENRFWLNFYLIRCYSIEWKQNRLDQDEIVRDRNLRHEPIHVELLPETYNLQILNPSMTLDAHEFHSPDIRSTRNKNFYRSKTLKIVQRLYHCRTSPSVMNTDEDFIRRFFSHRIEYIVFRWLRWDFPLDASFEQSTLNLSYLNFDQNIVKFFFFSLKERS